MAAIRPGMDGSLKVEVAEPYQPVAGSWDSSHGHVVRAPRPSRARRRRPAAPSADEVGQEHGATPAGTGCGAAERNR